MHNEVIRKLNECSNLQRALIFSLLFGFMHAPYSGRMNASFDVRRASTNVLGFKYKEKTGLLQISLTSS
jgi:hypothetical protein